MANRERGEIEKQIGDRTYTLALRIDDMCQVEAALSTPERRVTWLEALDESRRGGLTALRAIIVAAFKRHHAEMTGEQISALINQHYGWKLAPVLVNELFEATDADPVDLKALGISVNARPRKARPDSTGGASTPAPDTAGSTAASSGV